MARPRQYESDADRQAAYRERQRQEERLAEARRVHEAQDREAEEKYVRTVVAEALTFSKQISETDRPTKIGEQVHENRRTDRLKRAEAYARWRWAGYHAGEIASL